MTHTPRIAFKRGDTFKLDVTITDPTNTPALAALVILQASQAQLVIDQAALVVAQEAIPYVAQDETDAQAVVDATTAQIVIDQAAYDAAIIVDITNWTITSKMSWCGKLIQTFLVTITNAAIGELDIEATNVETLLWKAREYKMDILFVTADGSSSSETIYVDVERGATNG